jgi:hypothetical protein
LLTTTQPDIGTPIERSPTVKDTVSVPCPQLPLWTSSTEVGPANRLGRCTAWHPRDVPLVLGRSVRVEQRHDESGDISGPAGNGLDVDDSAGGLVAFRAAGA